MTKEELVQKLYSYAEDISKGKIVACKKHIQACRRFLRDIDRIPKKDFPYYFDAAIVERFYFWSRLFVHTKGVLANQPISLNDFQLFIVANIFGWKKKENDYKRFRKSYIQLARKNAKSQLLALITSFEAFLSGDQAECYIAGVSREQSSIVYNEIASQLRKVPMLKGKYQEAYGRIKHIKSGSIIAALSKESKKTADGKSPSLAVCDEFHVHPTSELYDILVSGQAARPNAHISIITTAGFSVAESPCFKEYQYVSQILDEENPIENDEYFVMIAELDEGDDPKDEKNWIKANPIVCSYPEGVAFLRGEMKAALDVPEKMRNFLTKNLNVWVQGKKNSYIPLDRWKQCETDFSLEDMRGLECLVGVDLSATTDLTSISLLFSKDEKIYVFNHSFMPSETVDIKRKTDKVPYDLWIKQGHITETEGSVVDYRYIEKYIEDLEREYDLHVKEVCSDPWNATQFMQNLQTKGYVTVDIRQGIQTLSAPTKNFRERVYAKTICHNANPVLTWAISNAIAKIDHNENIMLDKSKSTERIDPIASAINAHVRTIVLENSLGDINNHIMSEEFTF
jgi:phage terminase large subunit-like protein